MLWCHLILPYCWVFMDEFHCHLQKTQSWTVYPSPQVLFHHVPRALRVELCCPCSRLGCAPGLVNFLSTWYKLESPEKGIFNWGKMPSSDWPVSKSLEHFRDWCLMWEGLVSVRRQLSKLWTVSRVLLWFPHQFLLQGSGLDFLPWLCSTVNCGMEMNPFLTESLWPWCLLQH